MSVKYGVSVQERLVVLLLMLSLMGGELTGSAQELHEVPQGAGGDSDDGMLQFASFFFSLFIENFLLAAFTTSIQSVSQSLQTNYFQFDPKFLKNFSNKPELRSILDFYHCLLLDTGHCEIRM